MSISEEVNQIIKKLDLKPHPEGGFYKETYRSDGIISNNNLSEQFLGDRNYSTAIYFLLISDTFSAFHKINQDEIWHFYKGSAIMLHVISNNGEYFNAKIGNNLEKGEIPQYVVKANDWFAAEIIEENSYGLAGCTVSPGFDFRDFEMPKRQELISLFPKHEKVITRLTR